MDDERIKKHAVVFLCHIASPLSLFKYSYTSYTFHKLEKMHSLILKTSFKLIPLEYAIKTEEITDVLSTLFIQTQKYY